MIERMNERVIVIIIVIVFFFASYSPKGGIGLVTIKV